MTQRLEDKLLIGPQESERNSDHRMSGEIPWSQLDGVRFRLTVEVDPVVVLGLRLGSRALSYAGAGKTR